MRLNDEQKFRLGQMLLLIIAWIGIGLAIYFLYQYLKIELND